MRLHRSWFLLAALLLALACSPAGAGGARDEASPPAAGAAPAGPATAAAPATLPADPAGSPPGAPLVVFLGDSISAGLHLPREEAFPAVVQAELAAAELPFRLVNAGVSGDTTAGGLARLDWLLAQEPAVVVVELGGNDGLRGVDLAVIEANLRAILAGIEEAGAVPLLLGMRLPTNYGSEYGEGFAAIYGRLADETGVAHVPFFMGAVYGRPELFLPDGLHPTSSGHEVMAQAVAPQLRHILEQLRPE